MPKKDITEKGAVVQRDGETFAIVPRIPCGYITDFSVLKRIAEAAERYGARAIKITSSQRIAIIGIKEEDLDRAWSDLRMEPAAAVGLCVRSVKACPGTSHCKLGLQDSLRLGIELDARFANMPLPAKLKIAVSGCPMDCAESYVRDIGLIGSKKGFNLYIGGTAGAAPRLAETLEEAVPPDQAMERVARIIDLVKTLGQKKRLGAIVDEMGMEAIRQRLGLG